jgi:hypothetical protein
MLGVGSTKMMAPSPTGKTKIEKLQPQGWSFSLWWKAPKTDRLSVLAALLADIRHVLAICGYLAAALAANGCHVVPILRNLGTATSANLRHVLAVEGYLAAALAASSGVAV